MGRDVEAGAGVVLGFGVGGEDLDGVVDARDGKDGFVGVACEVMRNEKNVGSLLAYLALRSLPLRLLRGC